MKMHLLPRNLSETRTQPNLSNPAVHDHISLAVSLPQASLWQDTPILPPGSIEEFHLCQPLRDHGGKNQAE